MAALTKKEIIKDISDRTGSSIAATAEILEAAVEIIAEQLKLGNEISIHGLGKFSVADRAARTARNPLTGAPVEVPATKVPKFKPSKQLKDGVV